MSLDSTLVIDLLLLMVKINVYYGIDLRAKEDSLYRTLDTFSVSSKSWKIKNKSTSISKGSVQKWNLYGVDLSVHPYVCHI